MPLTDEEKRQIEEEERLRAEAMKPSWREKLSDTFGWMTQGDWKNPLTWNTMGIANAMNPMNPMLGLVSQIPTMIRASQGNPEAREALSSTARNNVNTLAAGVGAAPGGPTSMAVNMGLASLLGGARDAGDVADTLVSSALGSGAAKLPVKWGAATLPMTKDIAGKANTWSNMLRQIPLSLGLTSAGVGTAAAVRGENPIESRPIETAARYGAALGLPAVAANTQRIASSTPATKLRSWFDALLGKGKINTFGEDVEGNVIPQFKRQSEQAAKEIDQFADAAIHPRKEQVLTGERNLENQISKEQQGLLDLGVKQAELKKVQAQNSSLFDEAKVLAGQEISELDAKRALGKLELKAAKNTNFKELATEMNDVIQKGGAVTRDRTLARLLKESMKHPRVNEAGLKVIYNPETGLHDLPFQTAGQVDDIVKKIQLLGRQELWGVEGKTLAQQTLTSSRVGEPPPTIAKDIGRSLTPTEKSWSGVNEIEKTLLQLEQERAQLKGNTNVMGSEAKATNQSLKVAQAELEKTAKEKIALIGTLRTSLKALKEFNESHPIMKGTAREITGKDITPGLPLGSANPEVIASKFIDPPTNPEALRSRQITVRDGLNWLQSQPGGEKVIKSYQNLVKAQLAIRTFSRHPETVLGGVDPLRRASLLEPLFGKDEAARIAYNIQALETSVSQGRKILGHMSADRVIAETEHAAARSLAYQGVHGNPLPLVVAASVGITFIPIPFVNRILKDPVLGRQFQQWATEGGLMKANLRHYPILEKAVAQWPVTTFDKITRKSKETTIGALE